MEQGSAASAAAASRELAPPSVADVARSAGFSGELLCGAEAAARAGLSTRALLARHRRSVAAGRAAPAAFPDDRLRADGKPKVLWFPVEDLDAIAAERRGPVASHARVDLTDRGLSPAAQLEDPLARSDVVHAFELEVERLRGELAAMRAERDAASARAESSEAEALRLRAALAALAAPGPAT